MWSIFGGFLVYSFKQSLNSKSPADVHGYHHTDHVVWTALPSNQHLYWISLTDKSLNLKDNEWQSVPLVHPCSSGTSQWAILPSYNYYIFIHNFWAWIGRNHYILFYCWRHDLLPSNGCHTAACLDVVVQQWSLYCHLLRCHCHNGGICDNKSSSSIHILIPPSHVLGYNNNI
jgi:hypothetical protein